MGKRELQRSMYESRDGSAAQRILLAALAGLWVAVAWWLLMAGGIETARGWFTWIGRTGNELRRVFLAVGFSIYYVRILFTDFVFLKRGINWSEAFTVAGWLLCIVILLGIEGGANPSMVGATGVLGAIFFLVGSWMNSYAEFARHVWKQRPENRGRLYTEGLFRYSRHPNYLGDLISFSGLCLISGVWVTAIIPILMLCGFVFVNIPMLDSHLHDHYGDAFDEYASRTRKLIPFIY